MLTKTSYLVWYCIPYGDVHPGDAIAAANDADNSPSLLGLCNCFSGVQFVAYLYLKTYLTWECHYDEEDSLSLLEDQNVLPVSGRSAQRPRLVNGS